jgi:hypothetical protein
LTARASWAISSGPRGSTLVFLKAPESEELIEICHYPASGPVIVGPDLTHLAFGVDDLAVFAKHAAAKGYPLSDGPTPTSNGSIIALDPDIPPDRQRLHFGADGVVNRWLIDGKPFAKGPQAQWLPWPGRHEVQIVGAKGEVLDSIRLEVRGAGVIAKR